MSGRSWRIGSAIVLLASHLAAQPRVVLSDSFDVVREGWTGVLQTDAGRRGSGARFPASGGSIDYGDCPLRSDADFTLRVSLRTRSNGFATPLMARRGEDVLLSLVLGREPGKISFEGWSWTHVRLISASRVDDGAWHDIEVRYAAGSHRAALFVDLELEALADLGAGSTRGARLRLGNNIGADQPFEGELDELELLQGILPTAEFEWLALGLTPKERTSILSGLRGPGRWRGPSALGAPDLPTITERSATLRRTVADALGLVPEPPRLELEAQKHGEERGSGYRVERWSWATFPGHRAVGDLYLPDPMPPGRRPAILNPHGHWSAGGRHPVVQARARHFAQSGALALVVDSVHVEDLAAGVSAVGVMTWNNRRAIDLLMSRSDVDGARVLCTGASGGAQQTMYLMAIEPRLAAAAPICMISGYPTILDDHSAHCGCNHAPRMGAIADPPDICALFAPRPAFFASVTGDWTRDFPSDDWPRLKEHWRKLSAEDQVEALHASAGHNYDRPFREAVYRFFARHVAASVATPNESDAFPLSFAAPGMSERVPPPNRRALAAEALSRKSKFLDWRVAAPALPSELRSASLVSVAKIASPTNAAGWKPFRAEPRSTAAGPREPSIPVLLREHTAVGPWTLVVGPEGAVSLALASPRWFAKRSRLALTDPRFVGVWSGEASAWQRNGVLLGRSEAYEMAHDLASVAASLPGRDGVHLVALEWTAPAALLAATLTPRITRIVAPDLGPSYAENGNRRPIAAEILRYGDLDRLLRDVAIPPRSLALGGVGPALRSAMGDLANVSTRSDPLESDQIEDACSAP